MTNVEKLHEKGIVDKDKLNDAQTQATNSLSQEEITQMISSFDKITSQLGDDDAATVVSF